MSVPWQIVTCDKLPRLLDDMIGYPIISRKKRGSSVKYLLAKSNIEVLDQFAWSKGLLAFDYDGTLSPIVAERERARMSPGTTALFRQICRRYPCAVISGRSSTDVRRTLGTAAVKYVVGNHGMESDASRSGFPKVVERMRRFLEESLSRHSGIEIEDKAWSLSVHFRRSRERRKARLAIEAALLRMPVAARAIPGKCVVNVLPARARTKGDALLSLREQEGADTALYFGDDATDEDVFRLDQPGRLTTVRVGRTAESAAEYYLRGQPEIDLVLERLLRARKPGVTR